MKRGLPWVDGDPVDVISSDESSSSLDAVDVQVGDGTTVDQSLRELSSEGKFS